MDNQKLFLSLLIVVLSVITWYMALPFLGYILGAFILAFLMHPAQKELRKYTGPRVSSMFLMILSIVLAILPVLIASGAVVQDARDLSEDIENNEAIDIDILEQRINEATGREIDIGATIDNSVNSFISTIFGNFSQIINLAANMLIGFTMMMFLVYYLLKDGEHFVKWLKDLTPVSSDIKKALYKDVEKTTWAVIKGHVMVSITQGLVAGIGLWVAGIPNAIFWTFVMIILGFIPIVGSMFVWLPAGIYLLLIGEVGSGAFLLLYGFIIVSLVDNIVRPLAVDRGADLHPAAIILGVIGGVYLFGAAGLFIGPIILGVFKSALSVFGEHYS